MAKKAKLSLPNFFNRASLPKISDSERQASTVMIIDSDPNVRSSLRQFLMSLGFGGISDAPDHNVGLQKIGQRPFTHVIFDAKPTNMPAREFLTKLFECDEDIVAIPSSYEPSVDDVFDLLIVGAKGYLVKPCNEIGLEDSIVMATKGEPISDSILYAKNRNEALVSLIMTAVDKLATISRQAEQFETARRELPKARMAFKRAVEIGRTFAKGGEDELLGVIMEFCIDRSNGPASKLGRARQRINVKLRKKVPNIDTPISNDSSNEDLQKDDVTSEQDRQTS